MRRLVPLMLLTACAKPDGLLSYDWQGSADLVSQSTSDTLTVQVSVTELGRSCEDGGGNCTPWTGEVEVYEGHADYGADGLEGAVVLEHCVDADGCDAGVDGAMGFEEYRFFTGWDDQTYIWIHGDQASAENTPDALGGQIEYYVPNDVMSANIALERQ